MTLPEVALWRALRRRSLGGAKFRRQHPFGPYVFDFYCANHRLAVEVDGWGHNMGALGRDERRDAHVARAGVRTLRFSAEAVLKELDAVLDTIEAALRRP